MSKSNRRFSVVVITQVLLYGQVAYNTRVKYFDFLSDATGYANRKSRKKDTQATVRLNTSLKG